MPFRLEKLDGADNGFARFRLTHSSERVDVVFTRATFREVFNALDFSSQRIGSVLKLLNQKFPIKYVPNLYPPSPSDYSLSTLISYMQSKGYQVFRPLPFSDDEISFYLNEKGFHVCASGVPSSLYLFSKN